MILVTVGTNEQPFERLVRAVAALELDEPLVVQHGSGARLGDGDGWVDFVSFEELTEMMRRARLVLAHAGVGSIMQARRCGHRPLVMPRRLHLGEAVDDHQLPVARRLHAAGIVELVEGVEMLPELLSASERSTTPSGDAVELPDALALSADVRRYLEEIVDDAPHARCSAQQFAPPH